jgi:hypothetical protein
MDHLTAICPPCQLEHNWSRVIPVLAPLIMSTVYANVLVIEPYSLPTISIVLDHKPLHVRETLEEKHNIRAAEFEVFLVSYILFIDGRAALTLSFRGADVYPDFAPRRDR